jgi:predicted transcriptional regulator of viral defense system
MAKCHSLTTMPGRIYTQLLDVANAQNGFVTAGDAKALGVNPLRLQDLARRGTAAKVGHGLYRLTAIPATPLDGYMEATLWPHGTRGVLSHETALDLHEFCDINPVRIHITVPKAFRPRRETPKLYVVHRRDLEDGEKTLHQGIPIVTPFRAILDGIEGRLGKRLIGQAIENAERRGLLRPEELGVAKSGLVAAWALTL